MSLDKQEAPFVYTDEQLIARFQAGDENAYIELVNRRHHAEIVCEKTLLS